MSGVLDPLLPMRKGSFGIHPSQVDYVCPDVIPRLGKTVSEIVSLNFFSLATLY